MYMMYGHPVGGQQVAGPFITMPLPTPPANNEAHKDLSASCFIDFEFVLRRWLYLLKSKHRNTTSRASLKG